MEGVSTISKLATMRKAKGFTQEKLSTLSGVHRVSIAKYEAGVSRPGQKNLVRLARALDCSVGDLIEGV